MFSVSGIGHIACNCPNMCCFECDEYGHIAADCQDKIPPSGTPACHKRWHTRYCVRLTSRHHHWDRHRYSRSRSQSYSHGYQSNSCDSSCRSHSQSHRICPHKSTSDTITPASIVTAVTHHTGNLHHIQAYQPTPRDCSRPEHACHINPVRTPHLNPYPDLVG